MFQQKASAGPNTSVSWDYHVILLTARSHQDSVCWVYDIDSHLPYPSPLSDYLQHSFPYEWPMPVAPLFRVVDGDLFLQHFSSDRRHMYNADKNTWNAPPPSYAPIQSGNGTNGNHNNNHPNNEDATTTFHNLDHYLNFVERPTFTEIMMDPQALGSILTKQQLAMAPFLANTTR